MTGRRRRRDRAIQIVTLAITAIALVLLIRHARSVDWPQVWQALAGYRLHEVTTAAALAALSYLLYCSYELGARHYAGHGLSTRRTMLIGFTCYAFSLNIGALIGGGGFRLRLYSHSGLRAGAIGRIVAFAVSTNWSGYLVLAPQVWMAAVGLGLLRGWRPSAMAYICSVGLVIWRLAFVRAGPEAAGRSLRSSAP